MAGKDGSGSERRQPKGDRKAGADGGTFNRPRPCNWPYTRLDPCLGPKGS